MSGSGRACCGCRTHCSKLADPAAQPPGRGAEDPPKTASSAIKQSPCLNATPCNAGIVFMTGCFYTWMKTQQQQDHHQMEEGPTCPLCRHPIAMGSETPWNSDDEDSESESDSESEDSEGVQSEMDTGGFVVSDTGGEDDDNEDYDPMKESRCVRACVCACVRACVCVCVCVCVCRRCRAANSTAVWLSR